PFHNLMHCHCSMCRKHHGAPFATFVGVPAANFRWISGGDSVTDYPSSAEGVRRFCPICSAKAPTPMGELVFMPAGNLLGELGDTAGMHIFVGSKAPWHVIADDLPQHDTVPPGWPLPQVKRSPPPVLEGATHGSCLCGGVTFSVTGTPARWL